MDIVRQQDNIVSIAKILTYPSVNCSGTKTETNETQITFREKFLSKEKGCFSIFFIPADKTKITYYCDKLVDIGDIIAKYTSTEKGRKAFQKAEEELHKELFQEVLAGKLNRVRYYRIVNNLDQRTLAKLSGVKQPNISRIEKIGYVADADTYKKIAKVFKISYKELLP
jgi:DNA-binding XRE family transcriptional regulator